MQHVPRGFTLLELMVVLVIIGICTAGIGLGLGGLLGAGGDDLALQGVQLGLQLSDPSLQRRLAGLGGGDVGRAQQSGRGGAGRKDRR